MCKERRNLHHKDMDDEENEYNRNTDATTKQHGVRYLTQSWPLTAKAKRLFR